ncbi:MAG: MFS transporter [Dermatophilaceae bacterium]
MSAPYARRYVIGAVLDAAGSGLVMPVSIAYFVGVVGLTATSVATALVAGGVCGVAASLPAGTLIDRYGSRRVLVQALLAACAGYLYYGFAQSFTAFLVATCVTRVALRVARPARIELVTRTIDPLRQVEFLAFLHATQNAALGIGALIAAAALLTGSTAAYPVLFAVNAATFAAAAALVGGLPDIRSEAVTTGDRADTQQVADSSAGGWRLVAGDRPYLLLAGMAAVIALQHNVLTVAIPLWFSATHSRLPTWLPAVLYALNTALVVVAQPRVGRLGRRAADGMRAFRTAAIGFATACVLFACIHYASPSAAVAIAALGVVGLTVGEIFSGVGQWSASITLAREEMRGRYLSVFSAAQALEDCLGPALVIALIGGIGGMGWLVLGALLTAAALVSGVVGGRAVALASLQNKESTT